MSFKKVIGMVSLRVHSVENLTKYYEEIIGLSVLKKEENQVWLGTGDDVLLHLEEIESYTIAHHATGLYHTAFLLPNRDYLSIFLKHVFTHPSFIGASDHHVSEALYLEDPEGNGIEVYADRSRDQWTISQDGTITMATLPLDFPSLAAQSNEVFTKLPEGTMIGHIHLTVSDLSKTEKFYQELLGMNLVADYGNMAKFFSYNGYHHHVGTNIWKGTHIEEMKQTDLGLQYYTVVVSKEQLDTIVEKLIEWKMDFHKESEYLKIKDPNGISIQILMEKKTMS